MKKIYFLIPLLCAGGWLFSQGYFYNNGASVYVTPGAFMIVKGDSLLNEASGTVNNQGTIVIEDDLVNDATINGSSDTIKVQRNWINDAVYTGNNSLVELCSTAQLITGTAVTDFDNLQLDGSSGSGSVKTQTIDAVTEGILKVQSAELATDSFTMLVTNPSTGAITFNVGSGFISSEGAGQVDWVTNSTSTYMVPTGSPSALGASIFRPIEIAPNGTGPDTFGFCLVKGNATNDGYNVNSVDTVLCVVNPNFYHRLYRSGGDATALLMFYNPGTDGDWTDEAHWQNNVWNYLGPSSMGSGLGLTSVEVDNVNNFTPDPFALARKKFKVIAGPDITIVTGESTQLNPVITASGSPSIIWTPDAELSCDVCSNPVASPTITTQYKITVTDAGGCTISDSLIISVVGAQLLLPSGFSPNGDGTNDYFHILNKNIQKFDLQVFNRWGELVFESTDITVGWDGTYKNQKAEMGVYVWQCSYSLNGDSESRYAKGNVTLVR